jgi:O-antigen ligase
MSRSRKRARVKVEPPSSAAPGGGAAVSSWQRWLLFAVVLLPPFVLLPTAKDSFRLPKLVVSEWLALASLLPIAWTLGRRADGGWSRRRVEVVAAITPLLAVAAISIFTTSHPEHARRAWPSFAIGALCLAAWASAAARPGLLRALELIEIPAGALALLAVLQFHAVYRPFEFATNIAGDRLGVVSLAGNAGDLGIYLVLPCLLAQWLGYRATGGRRWLHVAVALICGYGIVASQTLTAAAALVVASAVLWAVLLPRRRALAGAAAVALAALLAIALLPPLRERVGGKVGPLLRGDWNELLTYRLDAWAAARWMLARHPLSGVGFGGYRAEYTGAKEALLGQGRSFSPFSLESTFANAHNDVLEVAAELGWPGVLALVWALVWVGRAAARAAPAERAVTLAGLAAMVTVALANFPFEIALVAYPWLVFLAWVTSAAPAPEATA